MILSENQYANVMVGVQDRVVASETAAQGETRDNLRATVAAFCRGSLKPLRVIGPVSYDAERNEILEHSATVDPKTNRRVWKHTRVKVRDPHVLTAKLFTRDRLCNEFDDNGNPVKPFVSITLVDGTRIEVPYFEPKRGGNPTT